MQPDHRLHILTIAATLYFLYLVFTRVVPGHSLEWLGSWRGAVVAYVSAYGSFKTFHSLIAAALNNWGLLKRYFLGKFYIEGTWVGYYYGEDHEIRYVVDVVSQEIGSPLQVRGWGFTKDHKEHATWFSTTASFANEGEKLIFAFDCEILSEPPQKIDGITEFQLQRVTAGIEDPELKAMMKRSFLDRSPNRITGSATNSGSGRRLEVNEVKLKHSTGVETASALVQARHFQEAISAVLKSGHS